MAVERPLTSDQLGNLGESKFIYLCEEGQPQLIVNKALRDQSGWDFIVEFPHNNQQRVGLDSRPNPIAARFQQKTMWQDKDRVKFKLSALERLAKDPGPAFICVLKYDGDLNCIECYLIHIIDDLLEFVLKELRKHEETGGGPLNKKEVYLYPSKFVASSVPSHSEIIEAIRSAVGEDLHSYVLEKADQLKNRGFEAARYDLSFILPIEDDEKVTDALLGISGEIEVSQVKGGETRFGIRLPLPGFTGPASITISAAPTDTCDLIFRRRDFPTSLSSAVMYSVPKSLRFDPDPKFLRCVSSGVDVTFRRSSANIKVNHTFRPDVCMSVIQWLDHFTILKMMVAGGADLDVRTKRKTFKDTVKIPPMQFEGVHNWDGIVWGLKALIRMLELVGYRDQTSLSYKTVLDLERQMSLAVSLFEAKKPISVTPFEMKRDLPDDTPEQLKGTYITYVDLGTSLLVWNSGIDAVRNTRSFDISFPETSLPDAELMIMDKDDYSNHVDNFRSSAAYPLVVHSNASW